MSQEPKITKFPGLQSGRGSGTTLDECGAYLWMTQGRYGDVTESKGFFFSFPVEQEKDEFSLLNFVSTN